jgi:hypothetical protein
MQGRISDYEGIIQEEKQNIDPRTRKQKAE